MSYQRTGRNPVKVRPGTEPNALLRYQRMARELRLMDQILSPDVDSVSFVDGAGSAPAWTSADGADVTIDVSRMPSLNDRVGVAVYLGTNAHELGHNLFTPRQHSKLMRRVQAAERSTDPGIHRSWNVLEDQRMERLLLARFAPWRGYLVAALSHHIQCTHPESWLLLAGRTFLPDEVRAIARATFVATNGEADAKRAAELIGTYQRLSEPGDLDADEAWEILVEFHDLFGTKIPRRGSCGHAGQVSEGEPEEADDASVSYPTADEADEDDDEGDDDPGEDESDDESEQGDGDESDGDSEGDDGDGDEADDGDAGDDAGDDGDDTDDGSDTDGDEGDAPGDGEGSGDDDGDADDEGDDEGDGNGEGEKGDGDPGDGTSAPDGERTISEAIEDAIDEALSEDETADDLDRVVDNLAHGATGPGNLPRTTGQWLEATNGARLLARDVTRVLSDIKDDCEASWVRRTDTGRFSVDRWATDPNWTADDVFDLFDPGAMDASSIDMVLVLDISGSMSSQNMRLSEATWAIRHAVDHVEGRVTVIGFGDDASLMFDAHHRPDGRMLLPHLEGSTNPTTALAEAFRLMADSAAANRIIIVLTDGQWWGANLAGANLAAAGALGVTTCVVGLGAEGRKAVVPGFAQAQITAGIHDSSELVPIFRQIAEQSMLTAMGGHPHGR